MQFYFDLLGALRHLVFLFAEAGAFVEAGIGPVTTGNPNPLRTKFLPLACPMACLSHDRSKYPFRESGDAWFTFFDAVD